MTRPVDFEWFSYCAMSIGVLVGCATEPEAIEDEVVSNIVIDNGISLNGISLNGISLNGISLNGISLNGISLNGISLNGISLNGVSVSGTQLRGTRSTGGTMSGAGVVGAAMKGQMSNGSMLDLRIDSSALLPAPNNDVRTYAISYPTTTGWKALCVGTTGANEAILFPGTWNLTTVRHQYDSNLFTVACRGATFAKCEELGYKGDNLIDTYHQACVRALRADYCGDGQSHTVNGTQINIFDALGRQSDTQAWSIESNWTDQGAICIGTARLPGPLTTPSVPDCMASRARIQCTTTSWPGGVLIRTEVNR
jgi:hypothetical protein